MVVSSSFVLISGIVNVKVLSLLKQPLTYQWLYYSDFLQSFDARHAIMASVSPRIVVAVILGQPCSFFAVGLSLKYYKVYQVGIAV